MNSLRSVFFLSCFLISSHALRAQDAVELKSPDGKLVFSMVIAKNEAPVYTITHKGQPVILPSTLGVSGWEEGVTLNGKNYTSCDTLWEPVYGERGVVRNRYHQLSLSFKNKQLDELSLEVRAYNEGIAFRYGFAGNGLANEIKEVNNELTEFTLPEGVMAWVTPRAQTVYELLPLNNWKTEAERPLVLQFTDGRLACLTEAGVVNYCRTKFSLDTTKGNTIRCAMFGEARLAVPFFTPWRVVMAGEQAGDLLTNNDLILNLNDPTEISDASWIKPGKVIREVTLTTQGAKACIDFASKHYLQYVEFDAGWYGPENDEKSGALAVNVDPARSPGPLSLQEAIDYGKQKGIGTILYVNQKALSRQLDTILPLYQSWGVKGVKFGFVHVGSQENTRWLHEAVRKAARHRLMVDIHDEYRPTGYSRTYPNLMTQEGICGDEESPDNHQVLITIFTRMIAGAGDQTNCYFAPRVAKMGSHVSQMAKAICIYSPWQFLYWYDRPQGSPIGKGGAGATASVIKEIPDLSFYDALPTVWDDTKVIEGAIGEYATIARRKGNDWFVGSLTNQERSLALSLDFLDKRRKYEAVIYTDNASLPSETKVQIRKLKVKSATVLKERIKKMNGLAMIIRAI